MNFIIYDLEATCWNQDAFKLRPQEIIEIGALSVMAFPSTPVKPHSNTAMCN